MVRWGEVGDEAVEAKGLQIRGAFKDVYGHLCLGFWSAEARCNLGIPIHSIELMEQEHPKEGAE